MKKRNFRVFAEKEDLQKALEVFQAKFDVYYAPAYSDEGPVTFESVDKLSGLGVNFHGSHIGNNVLLVFRKDEKCHWRKYEWHSGEEGGIRYSSLYEENVTHIVIDLNGIYRDSALFPTTISTMYYDNMTAKGLYDGFKRVFRLLSVKNVNGCFICPRAFEDRNRLRFCTIDIKSPPEYDLMVNDAN